MRRHRPRGLLSRCGNLRILGDLTAGWQRRKRGGGVAPGAARLPQSNFSKMKGLVFQNLQRFGKVDRPVIERAA